MEITIYDNKFDAANPMIQSILYGYVYDTVPDTVVDFLKENFKVSDSKQNDNKNDDGALDEEGDKNAAEDAAVGNDYPGLDYNHAEDMYSDLRKKLNKLKTVIKHKNKRKMLKDSKLDNVV